MHGKTSSSAIGEEVFKGSSDPLRVTCYHSLVVERDYPARLFRRSPPGARHD